MELLPFKQLLKEKFSHLSAGQKKVAAYMIENLDEAAFKTAYQIGRQADVSETTVIRLSYALGFEGFTEMQVRIQKQLLKQNQLISAEKNQHQRLEHAAHPFAKVIENEINILEHLLDTANVQEIWKAVDALIHADQILIAGHRVSYAAAYWFSFMLSTIRENVSLCSPAGNFFEKFCNLTNKSVVVLFSFPRYSTDTIKMAECTSENGITLISVTDRLLSPVGRISNIVLTTEEKAETGANSIASVISLLDLIIEGIHEKDQKRIHAHQEKLESLYSSFEVFCE